MIPELVAVVGALALASVLSWRMLSQVRATQQAQTEQIADALRLLASRDYSQFAAGAKLEARHVDVRPPTEAEIMSAVHEDAARRAQNDPYGVVS